MLQNEQINIKPFCGNIEKIRFIITFKERRIKVFLKPVCFKDKKHLFSSR